jgi:hypothetical protein
LLFDLRVSARLAGQPGARGQAIQYALQGPRILSEARIAPCGARVGVTYSPVEPPETDT